MIFMRNSTNPNNYTEEENDKLTQPLYKTSSLYFQRHHLYTDG